MMDGSAPTHKRRKLVKTYKNVLPQKLTMVAKVSGETYSKKCDKYGVEKRQQTITPQIKRGTQREKAISTNWFLLIKEFHDNLLWRSGITNEK